MPEVKPYRIDAMRELARERVAATSLRAVAEEIGMSFSGLRSFLDGRAPYPQTVKKLTVWYTVIPQGKTAKGPTKTVIPRAEVDAAVELLDTYMAADGDERLAERRRRQLHERLFSEENTGSK